ncbi:hypothetical protein DFH06DRAFT_1348106 [Mycena polygramma]|nr:hypothetical protein DFH06DRAFT_1348106 [Mycena polygramma]
MSDNPQRAAVLANPVLRAKARQIVLLRRWRETHTAGAALQERVIARLNKLRGQLHWLLRRERERLAASNEQDRGPDNSGDDAPKGIDELSNVPFIPNRFVDTPERRRAAGVVVPERVILEPGRGARTRVRYCTAGSRAKREDPLTTDALWLTLDRPPVLTATVADNECGLCHSVKSHPVRYSCGHSHCYVCVRLWLEHSWECPDYLCGLTMRAPPCADLGEEERIAETEKGFVDKTRVDYTWDGLIFPVREPRVRYVVL